MEITTPEQAKALIRKWLDENHHAVTEIKDDAVTFHFEIDYPLGEEAADIAAKGVSRPCRALERRSDRP